MITIDISSDVIYPVKVAKFMIDRFQLKSSLERKFKDDRYHVILTSDNDLETLYKLCYDVCGMNNNWTPWKDYTCDVLEDGKRVILPEIEYFVDRHDLYNDFIKWQRKIVV